MDFLQKHFFTYGNWCGPKWTAGQQKDVKDMTKEDINVPAVDKLDEICKQHDIDLFLAKKDEQVLAANEKFFNSMEEYAQTIPYFNELEDWSFEGISKLAKDTLTNQRDVVLAHTMANLVKYGAPQTVAQVQGIPIYSKKRKNEKKNDETNKKQKHEGDEIMFGSESYETPDRHNAVDQGISQSKRKHEQKRKPVKKLKTIEERIEEQEEQQNESPLLTYEEIDEDSNEDESPLLTYEEVEDMEVDEDLWELYDPYDTEFLTYGVMEEQERFAHEERNRQWDWEGKMNKKKHRISQFAKSDTNMSNKKRKYFIFYHVARKRTQMDSSKS